MKKVFKVTARFSGTCEFWFDANEIKTKEEAEREASRRLYNGKMGQYFRPIDVNIKEVEKKELLKAIKLPKRN